jgi:hypothetical protein
MATSCTHTHESGKTCQSPAVRGTSLCFHHTPHEEIKRRFPEESEPFELPKLHGKSALIVAISEILERMAQRRIKCSEARVFINGIGLSARLMSDVDREIAEDPAGTRDARSVIPEESEPTSESIQQMVDEIAEGLGIEMPTLEEMQKLQASMPDGTPEKALNHWISIGRIRPIRPEGARVIAGVKERRPAHQCPRAAAAAAAQPIPS